MQALRFTLVADGSSDRAILPVLVWLLREHFGSVPIHPTFADLRRLPNPPKGLSDRIRTSLDLYPCDLLFVHRDAERESVAKREEEILDSLAKSAIDEALPVIRAIPVRMQEAWLLVDEDALRRAAGTPDGRQPLTMPDARRLEDLPDPKQTLHDLLRQASGLRGRRLRRFDRDMGRCVQRVAEEIRDFRRLREFARVPPLGTPGGCPTARKGGYVSNAVAACRRVAPTDVFAYAKRSVGQPGLWFGRHVP